MDILSLYGQEIMIPGLERISQAVSHLLPKLKNKKIVIIAGTNGKGETTLFLSHLLKEKKHCVWTSPHIERLAERFRNQNGEIHELELSRLIDECHQQVVLNQWKLTYYEFLFLVFCSWASQEECEYLLLEVGLGGRMDAVNVLDADLVLLPSISRDHQEFLGTRYDQILIEKLGTLRPGATLIHFLELDYLIERSQSYAQNLGAKVIALKNTFPETKNDFSFRNYLLATAANSALMGGQFVVPFGDQIRPPLENRGEILSKKHEWHFFGAHNVDGMRKLIQFLGSGTYNLRELPFNKVIVAFSQRNIKDLKTMTKMLKGSGLGEIILTSFDHPKSLSAIDAEFLAREEGLNFVFDIEVYIHKVQGHQKFLVTGSYYFIGFIKKFARGE